METKKRAVVQAEEEDFGNTKKGLVGCWSHWDLVKLVVLVAVDGRNQC